MNCYLYLLLPWCPWYLIPHMSMNTLCSAFPSSKNTVCLDVFLAACLTVKEYSARDQGLFSRKISLRSFSAPSRRKAASPDPTSISPHTASTAFPQQASGNVSLLFSTFLRALQEHMGGLILYESSPLVCQWLPCDVTELGCCFREILGL